MAIVGDAYIHIHAVTSGMQKEVRDALNTLNAGTAANSAGKRVGRDFVDGFRQATSTKSLLSDFKKALASQSKGNSAATRAGRSFGRDFADGFQDTSAKRLFVKFRTEVIKARITLAPVVHKTGKVLGEIFAEGFREAASGNLFNDVTRTAVNLISEAANLMRKGLGGGGGLMSNLEAEAMAAKDAFNSLVREGYFLGPIISGIVATIGDLIFGLGAMVSAVGAATPALAALAGSFVAVLQGAAVAKLAFGGIGKAIGAINKGGAGGNQKAVEDARRRLALAYQKSAESMAAANDKVRKAQIELNAAYIKGAESLQQLAFNAEEAALSQEKAGIQLERAREAMIRAQDLPVNDRARREAELAFKEAELNYRKTTDQVNDLAVQQEYAARTGIEGTEEVIKAKENLAEAEAARAKQERDNAQNIAQAQLALAQAMSKTSSQMSQAMKDLSPEAQKFAKYIASLKPILLELRAAAGKQLFGPLESAIQNLVDNLVPVLKPILEATGKVLGTIAVAISKVFTSAKNLDIFEKIFGGANLVILQNFGLAFANILDSAIKILAAVSPLTIRFSEWVKTLTDGWVAALNADGAISNLTKKFDRAGDIAAILGGVLKDTYEGLKAFFGAGTEAGITLWQAFGDSMKALKAFSDEGRKSGELQKKFAQIARNVQAVGSALGLVLAGLWELSGNTGVETFVNTIKPAIQSFINVAKIMSGPDVAKAFGNFIVSFAHLIELLAEGGGVQMFFSTLTASINIINKIFENETVKQAFLFLAAIHGVTLAFGVLSSVATFAFKVLIGKGLAVMKLFSGLGTLFSGVMFKSLPLGATALQKALFNLGGVMRGLLTFNLPMLRAAFSALLAPISPVVLAVGAAVAIFMLLYQNSEKLRKAVSVLVEVVGEQLRKAWESIQKALEDSGTSLEGIMSIFSLIGDFIAIRLMPIITIAVSALIGLIGGLVVRVIKIVSGIGNIIGGIVDFFKAIWALISGDTDAFGKYLSSAWEKIISGIGSIIGGLVAPFVAVWNAIADGWNRTMGGFEVKLPDWMGGFSFTFPYLKKIGEDVKVTGTVTRARTVNNTLGGRMAPTALAEGGVVKPQRGGVHAILAEAGRAERVEPLDPNGLSARDKAMIEYFTRGTSTGGNTFNVYPSQGMDETELAYNVSRKVAWAMRRGV